MAFSSPPPSLILLFILASAASAATNPHESEDMLQSLRNYGYTLFTNSISTSDLKYQLLSDADSPSNFTLFAPRDELLYTLDMAADAAAYVTTLRYHVVPNCRHTFADLKNLSIPFLDTLLPHYAVLIGKVRDVGVDGDRQSIAFVVDGVRITFPDLYIGSRITVHGIDGILLTGLNMSRDLLEGNDIPPEESPAPDNVQFNRSDNNVSAPAPAPGALSISVAPASSEGNFSAKGSVNPRAPTPAPSNVNGDIPTDGTPTSRNDDAAPALGISTDRNNMAATPTARIDRSNISAATAPTISKDKSKKMKRLGGKRKQKGKAQRKELRHRRRRHARREASGDLYIATQ